MLRKQKIVLLNANELSLNIMKTIIATPNRRDVAERKRMHIFMGGKRKMSKVIYATARVLKGKRVQEKARSFTSQSKPGYLQYLPIRRVEQKPKPGCMTAGEMLGFTNRLKAIDKSAEPTRTHRLANLMTDLEGVYYIPALHDEMFEQENPHLMQLYRTVSAERSL